MKKRIPILSFLVMMCFGLSLNNVQAQDIHWSQFRLSPMNLSPAATAIFRGDVRFIGSYRNQWAKDDIVDYLTFSGSVDAKFINPKRQNGFFGGGLIFNYDQAGDLSLNLAQIGLNGSYTQRLAEKHFLTAGAQLGFVNRRYTNNLRVDNQYNGDIFVESLPTREPIDESDASFVDFSAGLNYHWQNPDKRSKLDLGVGLFHIAQPEYSFYEDETVVYPRRLSLYGRGTVGVGNKIDLLPMAMYQNQGKHTQTLLGLAGRLHLNQKVTKRTAVQLGINYRFHSEEGDAWIPNIEFHQQSWLLGVSYDINISEFEIATQNRGGLEVHLNYVITKVKMDELKICPIF